MKLKIFFIFILFLLFQSCSEKKPTRETDSFNSDDFDIETEILSCRENGYPNHYKILIHMKYKGNKRKYGTNCEPLTDSDEEVKRKVKELEEYGKQDLYNLYFNEKENDEKLKKLQQNFK